MEDDRTATELDRAKLDMEFGPFFSAVDHAFTRSMAEFGYEVRGVVRHFRGSYVVFAHGACSVTVELADLRDLRVDVRYQPVPGSGNEPASANVWDVLAARDPTTDWSPSPRQRGLSDERVAALLSQWADGLVRLAPDILRSCR